jgi:hypothetical protein
VCVWVYDAHTRHLIGLRWYNYAATEVCLLRDAAYPRNEAFNLCLRNDVEFLHQNSLSVYYNALC